ncbi:MAG: hypothetical protein M2R45_05386 [Verrucomicrobia subdivision 3 bacterium]|nr:hypothetical protein [Limisphaerales bacterium]MCS1415955.1 hypothetical protein [Limisphaerales bacterium]
MECGVRILHPLQMIRPSMRAFGIALIELALGLRPSPDQVIRD